MRAPTACGLLSVCLLGGCSDHAVLFLGTRSGDSTGDEASSATGPALHLMGPDAHIVLGHTAELDLTDHFTLEAWLWPFATEAGEMLLCKSDPQREDKSVRLIGQPATPAVSLEMSSAPSPASLSASAGLTAQSWHHLALSYGDGHLQLFIDGQQSAQLDRDDPVADGSGTLYLGACLADTWLPSRDVGLSDVRLSRVPRYTADFTPEARLPADAEAIALYRLDEGQSATASDAGPHGLDASIGGSARWVQLPARSAK